MEFRKRHETTDTTDFCPRQLVSDSYTELPVVSSTTVPVVVNDEPWNRRRHNVSLCRNLQ